MFLTLDIERWPAHSRGSRRALLLAHCEGEGPVKSPAKWFSALVPHQSDSFFLIFSLLPIFDDFRSNDNVAVRDGSSVSSLVSIRSHKQQPWQRERGLEPFDWSEAEPERLRPTDVPSVPVAKGSCTKIIMRL